MVGGRRQTGRASVEFGSHVTTGQATGWFGREPASGDCQVGPTAYDWLVSGGAALNAARRLASEACKKMLSQREQQRQEESPRTSVDEICVTRS